MICKRAIYKTESEKRDRVVTLTALGVCFRTNEKLLKKMVEQNTVAKTRLVMLLVYAVDFTFFVHLP